MAEAGERAERQEPPELVASPLPANGDDATTSESSGIVAARIAGIFAIVGVGLGTASLLFLWESGFFDVGAGESFEDFAEVAIGAFALAAVAAFAVPLGIVLAAVGGLFAARHTDKRSDAVRTGAIGAAAGYLALSLVLSGFVVFAIETRSGLEPDESSPTPSGPRAACERVYGVGSATCRDFEVQGDVDFFGEIEDAGGWSDDIARLGLGIIPTALVGALTAAVVFPRRRAP